MGRVYEPNILSLFPATGRDVRRKSPGSLSQSVFQFSWVFFGTDDVFRSEKGYQCQNSLWDWWGDGQVTTGNSGWGALSKMAPKQVVTAAARKSFPPGRSPSKFTEIMYKLYLNIHGICRKSFKACH